MELSVDRIASQLAGQPLRPVYLVAGPETLLVLDAVTGQNAINQAREFIDAASATGIILTKLDGTAKGGAVISIKAKLGLPVRFVGVGEGIDDLMEFDPDQFVNALFLQEV